LALAFNLERNLVVSAADTTRAGFHVRLGVFHGLLKYFQWVLNLQLVGGFL